MTPATLKVPGRSLGDWLQEISQDKKTGKLSLAFHGRSQDLYFVAGDLYLAPEHSVFEAAKVWLVESGRAAKSGVENEQPVENRRHPGIPEFRQLAGPIIGLTGGSEDLDCTFVSGAGQIRLDLAGPLPTRQLLMETAVWSLDEQGLLRRLGGDQVRLHASQKVNEEFKDVELDPQEAFLLSRLDPPASVSELVNQLDLDRPQVFRSLTRLLAVGLISKIEEGHQLGSSDSQSKERLLSRFEESIGDSLESEPLEIGNDQHREVLGNLLSRMGEMSYFEMLAVSGDSSEEEIHKAYFELGRLVHPGHANVLGLEGKEGAFRVLFERATDAYLTLNDSERRFAYLKEVGPTAQIRSGGLTDEARDKEKQKVARQNYERALGMSDRQDYHSAIQLLEQAVETDPQAEYLILLGDCQAENPQWLDRATSSYRRALQARPGDPSVFSRLGRAFERQGDKQKAKQAYEAALEVAPEMESAKAGIWRLGGGAAGAAKPSLAARLRRFLRVDSGR